MSKTTKADMNHVAYKGEAPMLQELVGGQLQLCFSSCSSIPRPFIESGRVKAIGVTGTQRMDILPKVPTMSEQGIKDEVFQVTGWLGMSAPARHARKSGGPPGHRPAGRDRQCPRCASASSRWASCPVGAAPSSSTQFKTSAPVCGW
jgi:hypothetical protein